MISYDQYGEIGSKHIYKYDVNNNVTEELLYSSKQIYDSFDNLSHQYIYKYDINNNIIEEVTYYKGNLDNKVIYKYDIIY